MKVVISDIARQAGVSSGTVSNAINNRKGISEQKRQAILKIARDMGYFDQREIKKTENQKIKFVVMNKQGNVVGDTPFFSELIRGIEMECSTLGYELVISHITLASNEDPLETIRPEAADGLLLLGTELEKKDLEAFRSISVPLVILDTIFNTQDFDFVAINNRDSAYEIVEKMIDKGHRDIGIINSTFQINNFRERKQGFLQAIQEHDLIHYEETEALVEPTLEGSYQDMKVYLESMIAHDRQLPTAFFAVNDNIAIGAMKAIKETQSSENVTIVGFDDIPLAEFCSPPLTTVKVDKVYLGRQAVRRLFEKITTEDTNHVKMLVGTTIVERESIQ
ncbi:LacI family DNA-binding transcriptional regulator [Enterococcus sp. RIT-PI-f]|uniref:LacI family DNA-binding transcriptional regulator n=1 Tax=Enterococcus sp. RIT-PI-f TaxID=1690244 RepID=UPI0006B93ADE|nr:LacI family DNA-binding transcriptional regulator [Enterococcus sp. RIT-PI-f]KPG68782.1 LacI family transcriptional regulator [Enterococcus sp. RIT-PI-f]